MLRIDLSGMSPAELRRLLAAAEARGQSGLAERFRSELAGRAAGEAARSPSATVAFDDDEPGPMVVASDPRPPPLDLAALPARSAGLWRVGLGAAGVFLAGAVTAWGLSGTLGWPLRAGDSAPAPRAMMVRAVTAPAGTPAVAAVQPPAAGPKPTTPAMAAPATRTAADPEPQPDLAPRRVDPCAAPPTPADRLLCNDLALNLLKHEARDAYGRALAAGADPAAVRVSEAAWRRSRDPTSDPRALAELYERRIRELNAMAAEATAGGGALSPASPASGDRQQN